MLIKFDATLHLKGKTLSSDNYYVIILLVQSKSSLFCFGCAFFTFCQYLTYYCRFVSPVPPACLKHVWSRAVGIALINEAFGLMEPYCADTCCLHMYTLSVCLC